MQQERPQVARRLNNKMEVDAPKQIKQGSQSSRERGQTHRQALMKKIIRGLFEAHKLTRIYNNQLTRLVE